MNSYRGITYEVWREGGYIVQLWDNDEIYCEDLETLEKTIDEYLDN